MGRGRWGLGLGLGRGWGGEEGEDPYGSVAHAQTHHSCKACINSADTVVTTLRTFSLLLFIENPLSAGRDLHAGYSIRSS